MACKTRRCFTANDITWKLQQLGFSSYEAKAYCALLQKHPAHGYEVSKVAKIPPSKIYETLARLKSKGAVIDSSTDPVRYYPVAPDTLLHRLRQDFVSVIEELGPQLQRVQPFPDVDLTWNLGDYKTVIDKIIEVINNAGQTLLLSIWPEEAVIVRDHVAQAEKRGVRVIAGIFGDCPAGCGNYVNLEPCGASSEKRLGKKLTVAVGDSNEVVISEIGEEDARGIWTTTPGIVLVAKEYIKHDIWGRYLISALGEDRFKKMCEDNEILGYLINNR